MSFVQGSMKELNRKTVFDLVSEHGEITRTEIAEQTKSSMPTVLKIMNFFQEQEMVSLVGSEKTARGRHPQVFRFESNALMGVGVACDGHQAVASLVNYYGEEKASVVRQTDKSLNDLLETEIPQMIEQLIAGERREFIRGVGVCISGSVDMKQTVIYMGGYSALYMERDVAQSMRVFEEKTGLPVYLFNDVNAAVTGEYVLRKMKNEDLLYIYVGEGTGAGLILDGVLREGRHYYTGEVAHMVFDADFVLNRTEPGWMEARLSRKNIRESALAPAGRIDYAARNISLMIANICNVLDVENVVLGGESIRELGDTLLDRTQSYLDHLLLFPVKLSKFANAHSELIGGAYLALQQQLTNILADSE